MVKFSKQFEGQLVPEWKEAFVDYCKLKKEIKKIHFLNNLETNSKKPKTSFSHTILSSLRKYAFLEPNRREHGVIHVTLLPPSISINKKKVLCSVFCSKISLH